MIVEQSERVSVLPKAASDVGLGWTVNGTKVATGQAVISRHGTDLSCPQVVEAQL